jgi:hypothetical protein
MEEIPIFADLGESGLIEWKFFGQRGLERVSETGPEHWRH